jgi:hypothetical protein
MPLSSTMQKWKYTLITTFILFLIFNHYAFILTDKLLSPFLGKISTSNGCPTTIGFILHLVVFTLIIRYTMDLHI